MRADFTPERIEELSSDEIFVFGSNLNGNHYGGAARIAYEKFGAEWGVAEGLSGNTYAIPTLDKEMQPVSETDLFNSICSFIAVIKQHPDLTFYLTKIGCGIAGWNIESVRKLFWKAIHEESGNKVPNNLVMPYEFYMAQAGYMKKNELLKVLEEERLRREQLGNLASSAVTEEESERYHNEIVDCESAIQLLEEDLKMYD